jgi:hypothetical protein
MTLLALPRVAIRAAIVAVCVTGAAIAQTADRHHPDATSAQATPTPESGGTVGQGGQGEQSGESGMMGRNTMHLGMGGMPMMAMRGHMMKVMFAIADVDGDGVLSFEEVTTIQKRIFDKVDANKSGRVTSEEVQTFM